MTKPFFQTKAQSSQFAASKYLIAQAMVLPTVLQLLIATSAIAQYKPPSSSKIEPIQNSEHCHWSVSQNLADQSPKGTATNLQSLSDEIEALAAIVQNPSQLAFRSQLMITETDVAIGGGDDPESLLSDRCWEQF